MSATTSKVRRFDGDTISVEEGGALIGKSRLAMYRAIRMKIIPAGVYWKVGRDIYVSRARLIAWRDAGGSAAAVTLTAA